MIGPGLATPFDLSFAALNGASLDRAMLDGVDFTSANLAVASFGSASLNGARLKGANLDEAVFVGAHMRSSDLMDAYIGDADFTSANLHKANLSRVRGFADAKLQAACLVPNGTQMPAEFDWTKYRIPSTCCDLWSGPNGDFERRSDGVCTSKSHH